jgi:hypothetical protein
LAKVPLKYFYKSTWKLLAILLVAAIVLLIIGTFLPKAIIGR